MKESAHVHVIPDVRRIQNEVFSDAKSENCIIRDADFNSDHYGLPAIICVRKFFFHFVFISTKSAVVGSWSPYDLNLHTNAS